MNNKVFVEHTVDKNILIIHQYKSKNSTSCHKNSIEMIIDELKYWDISNCFACKECYQYSDSPNPS